MINIKKLDPNETKMKEKSYKKMFVYYIRYMTVKNLSYAKVNSVNRFYFIFNKTQARRTLGGWGLVGLHLFPDFF